MIYQWIRLRKNLNRKPWIHTVRCGFFPVNFPRKFNARNFGWFLLSWRYWVFRCYFGIFIHLEWLYSCSCKVYPIQPNTLKVNIGLQFPKSFLNNLFIYPDFGGNSRNLSTPTSQRGSANMAAPGFGPRLRGEWPSGLDIPAFIVGCYGFYVWLVVSTPLKNISQLGLLFLIYGKNVPNHQPDVDVRCFIFTFDVFFNQGGSDDLFD